MAATRLRTVLARRDVRLLGVLVVGELCLLAVYLLTTPGTVTTLRYTLYPFVWINLSVLAVVHTTVPDAPRRRQVLAGIVAVGYLLVLLWLAGLVGVDLAASRGFGVEIFYGSPGWQRISFVVPVGYLTIVPFRVVGYLALAFLVFVTLLETARAVLGGAVGVFSCVSCVFPVVLSLASGLFGSSAPLTEFLVAVSLDLSTAVFVLALGTLYYRPWRGQRIE